DREAGEDHGGGGVPRPPGALGAREDEVEDHHADAAEDDADEEALALVAEPGGKRHVGEAVVVLAEVALVDGERKAEDAGDDEVLHPVDAGPERPEAREPRRVVAHLRRGAAEEEDERGRAAADEVSADKRVAAR